MDYSITAKKLLSAVGGAGNIQALTHCMTRMRFVLKDDSSINDETVKAIPGVLGVARKGGQYQVIIGNDVTICYAEFMKLGNFGGSTGTDEPAETHKKFTFSGWVNSLVDAIAGSIAPILPVIIGCGMLKLLLTILTLLNVSSELPTYQILTAVGDAGFYFLPILLAASAADKFKCSRPLAMVLTAILVHPDLITLFGNGNTSFLHLPVTAATYSSSVIPALLITWVLSRTEPFFDRHFKGWVKTIFKPALIILIGAPLSLIVLAPVGAFLGDGLAFILNWSQEKAGWLMIAVISAFMPLIVMAGMHYALIPNCLNTLGLYGFETLLGPTMLASNFSQASACAAVAIKSKNGELKALAMTSSISALVAGITEPALYGVTLRLKKPLIASMIGSGCAGLFAGIVGLRNYALVTPSLVSIVQFISTDIKRNFLYACITVVISAAVTFVLTLILGWDDPVSESEALPDAEAASHTPPAYTNVTENDITAPIKGELVPLSQVDDETFASEVLGKGIAIKPLEGRVFAPFDGVIENIFDTKHALGLKSDSGIELLIHFGLETVSLGGEGFHPAVENGQQVHRGDLLMNVDLQFLTDKGFDTVTPVIITNTDDYEEIIPGSYGPAEITDTVLSVKK